MIAFSSAPRVGRRIGATSTTRVVRRAGIGPTARDGDDPCALGADVAAPPEEQAAASASTAAMSAISFTPL
jgi:hypothetical protein